MAQALEESNEQGGAISLGIATLTFAVVRIASQVELEDALNSLDKAIQACVVGELLDSSRGETYRQMIKSLLMKQADVLEELGDYERAAEIRRKVDES